MARSNRGSIPFQIICLVTKIYSLVFMGIKKTISKQTLGNKEILIIFIGFLFLGYLVYKPAFSAYFFQDDWFTLKISTVNSLIDFLKFFLPNNKVIYYRPLGMQVYFFVMRGLFGINPIFFRLTALIFHSFNALLVVLLLRRLNISKLLSLFAGVLYTTSVVSFIPFYWSATFPFILGVTFFLLSFYCFISSDSRKNMILSFLFYLLGLLTLEIIAVLPLLLILWIKLIKKSNNLLPVIKYFFAGFLYFIFRFLIFGIPFKGSYKMSINILPTLRSYFLWSFNWPEEMSKQISKIFNLNKDFLFSFRDYINIWIIGTTFIILLSVVIPLILSFVVKKNIRETGKYMLFGLAWYLLPFGLLLLFSEHTYAYYLPVSLVGLVMLFSLNINNLFICFKVNKIYQLVYLLIIIIAWSLNSLTTIRFNLLAYWVPRTACQAHEAVIKALEATTNTKDIYFRLTNDAYRQALNDQDAFQVIFQNDQVKTVYRDESYQGGEKKIIIDVVYKNCEGLNKKF